MPRVSRIALLYALLAGLWIFALDLALDYIGGRAFWPGHLLLIISSVLLLYLVFGRDLRAREQAEARLADLVDSVVDAIVAIDEEQRIFLFNQGAQRVFGYRPEEVLGQKLAVLLPERFSATHRVRIEQFIRSPEPVPGTMRQGPTIYGRRKDGTEFPAEASLSRSKVGGRMVFTAIVHDISERRRAEEALQRAHGELEQRVRERTEALTQANAALQAENTERRRVEAELEALVGEYDRQRHQAQELAALAQFRADELGAVFAAMTDPVVAYDAQGQVLRINPAAEKAKFGLPVSCPADDEPASVVVYGSNRQRIAWEYLPLARALRGETVTAERLLLIGRDGQEGSILASASPLYRGEVISGAVVVWHYLTEHERLRVLEERQHLARELHDSLTQVLYGISLGAHTARTWLDTDRAKVLEALDYIIGLGEAGLSEMRALIFDLRPEALEREGLVKALSKRAAAVQARFELDVNTQLCDEPDLSLQTKEELYRIAQEILHNVVQHAGAARLDLRLGYDAQGLLLEIADDGVGFDPSQTPSGHLGLRSMQERARFLGGHLQIDSTPGKGTRVHLRIPPSH